MFGDAQESLCTVFIECNKIFLLLLGLKNILCHLSKAKLSTETFLRRLPFVNFAGLNKNTRTTSTFLKENKKEGREGEKTVERNY